MIPILKFRNLLHGLSENARKQSDATTRAREEHKKTVFNAGKMKYRKVSFIWLSSFECSLALFVVHISHHSFDFKKEYYLRIILSEGIR